MPRIAPRRKGRLAAAALGAALALPGLAVANHTTCDPPTDPCGAFNPNLAGGAQIAFTDTPSTLTYVLNEADHAVPTLGITYLVPIGWQFAVNTLRPAQVSEPGHPGKSVGDPATSCSEVFVGEQNDNDDAPASPGRAENIAFSGIGASGWIENTRPESIDWGKTRQGPSGGNRNQNPAMHFLNWDAATQTATMCLYLYANNDAVATPAGMPFLEPSQQHEAAREHIIPVLLRKIQPGELLDGEDLSTTFGWAIEFDLTSFYGYDWLRQERFSLRDLVLIVEGVTRGNWHRDEAADENAWLEFSKTPQAPGTYEFRGIFTTCANGFGDRVASTTEGAEALSPAALCDGGALHRTSRSFFQKILHPAGAISYDWGKLTGPAGSLPQDAVPRFGLVRGTGDVTFTWTQPPMPVGETIKGYVLIVARPGNQGSRAFERVVTNPEDPAFDQARAPCGADGAAPACSLSLSFPLNAASEHPLGADGKYDVALVTMYEGGPLTDRRSDGLCDDGTGPGGDCPVDEPAFRIEPHRSFDVNRVPGISTWQFALREKAWPVAYVQTATVERTGGGPSFDAPLTMLLVDFDLRQGEFVVWNALGFEERFAATSTLIVGDNATGGLVSFGSASMTGHTLNWRFDGRILPVGGLIDPAQPVFGTFLRYNLRGAPGATPTGTPEASLMTFAADTPV